MTGDPEVIRRLETAARKLGTTLGESLAQEASHHGESWGFCLLLFRFDGPETTYIANADRPGMIRVLREAADRIEGAPPESIT